jgi:ABC-type lipoprotein release transport system permease subunit
MIIWSIAWKNVWRSKRRSLVVIAAVTIGIISGVLLIGIWQGWTEQRLHDAIYNEVSHVQVHNDDYLKNEEIDLTVKDQDGIIRCLDSLPDVLGWVKRTKIIAMANTSWANTGIILYGIDPEKEKQVTEIYKKILSGAGEYPDINNPGDILISDKTAEVLKLKQYIVNDGIIEELRNEKIPETILTQLKDIQDQRYRSPKDFREALKSIFTKKELDMYGNLIMDRALDYRIRNKIQITMSDLKGNPVQGIFRVCGIYKTTNSSFDQASVFVNAGAMADLYGSGEILTHEIAVLLNNIDDADSVKEKLGRISSDNSVMTWKELAPDAAMMNDFMIMYYFIFVGIIMLALAFGIINTMLMAILERTRELGMLMAIGMNRQKIFYMIMYETIFLTIVGAITGMLSGWVMIRFLDKTGIQFTGWGEGFEAIGFAAKVFPVVTPNFFLITIIMVISTAIISSIWPARKALKLNPVETLRTE